MTQGNSRPPSSSSSGSDRYSSTQHSTHSGTRRHVRVSDIDLADFAAKAEASVRWGEILKKGDEASGQWTWIDAIDQFAVYSKQEPHRYAVLASGVVSCSVPEVMHLLHSPNAEKYLVNMEALHGDKFKDGAFVHQVDLKALEQDGGERHPDLLELSVKSAVFGNQEKWSFLDASYRRQDGQGYEKISATLDPSTVGVANLSDNSQYHVNNLYNITTAFSVLPEQQTPEQSKNQLAKPHPANETRVFFYAEFHTPARRGHLSPEAVASSSHDKAIKQRLLKMAKSCARLTELVRRRRLGLCELADHKQGSLFSSSSSRCVCCNKTMLLLGVKHCRICGESVCSECSHKHERETRVQGSRRMLVEDVRACDRCMDRVDRSTFPELDDRQLLRVASTLQAPKRAPAQSSTSVLEDLLKDHLFQASTKARQDSVLNLIKCMREQDGSNASSRQGSSSSSFSSTGDSSRRGGRTILLHTE